MPLASRTAGAPTLDDVARVAGVSRATVSRVINGKRDVAAGLRSAVQEAVLATGYVPNRAARSLVTRRTGTVCVVVAGAAAPGEESVSAVDFTDPFFGRAVGGLLRALRPLEVDPVLMLAETGPDRDRVLSYLRNGNADGALLVSTHSDDPLPGLLVGAEVPTVVFARPGLPVPVSYVDVANRNGGALAADHLLGRGCRRIGAISGPLDVPAARDRLEGFTEALARAGTPWVPTTAGGFTHASGAAAAAQLLDTHPDLDGIFAANDLMALGAADVLAARGRTVPDDVALVGFDDSPLAALARPALTSVRQPIEEMVAEMARILLDRIAEPGMPPTSTILDPRLVVRASA